MKESPLFRESKASLDADDHENEKAFQAERALMLAEVMTPELRVGYGRILARMKEIAQAGIIDVEQDDVEIEAWTRELEASVRQRFTDWNELDFEGLGAESWNFFDSLARVLNTRKIEAEVAEALGDVKDVARSERPVHFEEATKRLVSKYGVSPIEAEILVKSVAKDIGQTDYSLGEIAMAVVDIWKEYDLGEHKGQLAKISVARLFEKLLDTMQPYLLKDLIPKEGGFNFAVFLEMFGLQKLSYMVDMKIDELEDVFIRAFRSKSNERMVDYLFYSDFDVINSKTVGESLNTAERGLGAVTRLFHSVVSDSGPTVAGMAMSATFLAQLHPMMAAVGISSLPVISMIARRHSRARAQMTLKENKATDAVDTRLKGVQGSFEEVVTSPGIDRVAESAFGLLEQKEDIELAHSGKRRKQRFVERLPYDVSKLVSVAVGYSLFSKGLIGPGAVLSNFQYVEGMQRSVNDLLDRVLDRLSANVRDIERMETMFGTYEDLDRPGGEKDEARRPASERVGNGISIKGLSIKGIMKDVNIEVDSGEFVVLRGPSGVGKTTLLRSIVGLYRPTHGEIAVGGIQTKDIKKFGQDSLRSIVAYASQKPNIVEDLTLRENLSFWVGQDAKGGEIESVLRDLNLDKIISRLDEKGTKLSGGELVRFGLARALLRKPEILLLDEPTASLDEESARSVLESIHALKAVHPEMTVICVSHDKELSGFGREIQMQTNGKFGRKGSPEKSLAE